MVEKENKEIKKAVETLNRISLGPKERELYDSIVLQEFNRFLKRLGYLLRK